MTKLATLLDEKHLTYYKVSKDLGIPNTTLRYWVSGERDIKKAQAITLYKLCKYLGVSMEYFLED